MNERIVWIDYAKALLMLLVVCYHSGLVLVNGAIILPAFFFISGYLFNAGSHSGFAGFIKSRLSRLLAPYLAFGLLFYACWLALQWMHYRATGGVEVNWLKPLVEVLLGKPKTIVTASWFIVALLVVQVLYYGLVRLLGGRLTLAVCLALSLTAYYLPYIEVYCVTSALFYSAFYAIGNSCKGAVNRIICGRMILLWAAMFALAVVISVHAKDYNHEVENIMTLAAGTLAMPFIIALSKWLGKKLGRRRVVETVAVNAVAFLCMQNDLITYLDILQVKALGCIVGNALFKCFKVALVMAVMYAASVAISRYAPWMIGNKRVAAA